MDIHGAEGPRISINCWGDKEHRDVSFFITTMHYSQNIINSFYDNVLSTKKADKLNLDSLTELVKKHFEKHKN